MGVVFSQSLKGTIVNFVGAFIGFLTTFFVTTKFLTPEEIGLTRVLIEAGTLISSFALLGMQSSSIRYYPYFKNEEDGGRDRGFLTLMLLIPLAGILLFGALYLLLSGPIVGYFTKQSEIFGSYYLFVIPMVIFMTYQALLETYATLKSRVAVPKSIREVVLRLLLLGTYLVYASSFVSRDTFICLFVGAYGLAALLNVLYVKKLAPQGFTKDVPAVPSSIRKDFAKYTALTLLAALGGNIAGRLDLFMVSSKMGFDYGGIYSIAFFMVAIIDIPARSLIAMSSPRASKALSIGDTDALRHLFKKVSHNQLIVGTIIFLLIWINIDAIFEIIPGTEIYAKGKWVVFFLGLGRLVDISFSFGNSILRYSRYFPWALAFSIITTLLTLYLNAIFIDRFGMSGAAIATLLGCTFGYLCAQIVLYQGLKSTPIDRRFLYIVMVLVIGILCNHFLPHAGSVYVDALWRSLVIMSVVVTLLLLSPVSQDLKKEVAGLIDHYQIPGKK